MGGLNAVTDWVIALVETPWVLLVVLLLTTIDGFFPPLPSESVVIAVAALVVSGSGPSLWLLMAAAALGALSGDVIAYHIGRALPLTRMRWLHSRKGQRAFAWAETALQRRATVLLMSARFVPIGRVAINITAGAVRFPRPRFILTVAAAGVLWAAYSTLLGMAAGSFLDNRPVVAVGVGVFFGVLMGVVFDWMVGHLNTWLEFRREKETSRRSRVGDALLRGTAPLEFDNPFNATEFDVPSGEEDHGPAV